MYCTDADPKHTAFLVLRGQSRATRRLQPDAGKRNKGTTHYSHSLPEHVPAASAASNHITPFLLRSKADRATGLGCLGCLVRSTPLMITLARTTETRA